MVLVRRLPKMILAVLLLLTLSGWTYQAGAEIPPARSTEDAQGNIHLGGDYIEFGIGANGSSGQMESQAIADGFFGRIGGTAGGFLGDADGFGEGKDLRIDYFLPGTPAEGWAVSADGTNYLNRDGVTEISYSFADMSSGDLLRTTGTGTTGNGLQIDHDISFSKNYKYIRYDVTLTNTTGSAMTGVAYMRSFDPDNTVDFGGDFDTINTVKADFATDEKVVVEALSLAADAYETASGSQALIRYFSRDSRAVPRILPDTSLMDTDAQTVVNFPSARDTTSTVDGGISIGIDIGTLAAGANSSFTFYVVIRSSNGSVSTPVNVDYAFTLGDFDYVDPDIEITGAIIKTLPLNGTLFVDVNDDGVIDTGEEVSSEDSLSAVELQQLKYRPETDWSGITDFVFQTNGVGDEITMAVNVESLPPSATTLAATNVASAGATLNGTVNANGDSTAVIFQYGTSTAYGSTVTAEQSPVTGTDDVAVSAQISGLDVGQTYFYRVAATNDNGTTNGVGTSFTTDSVSLATLTTNPLSAVQSSSATGGGTISADGGMAITARGICWSTSPDPTIADTCVSEVPSAGGTGAFSLRASGLRSSTTYFLRAFATNSVGTAYGNQQVFRTTMFFYLWAIPAIQQGVTAPR